MNDVRSPQKETYSTPRWVKVLGVSFIVLVLVLGIMMLASGGDHGPSRHAPSRDTDGNSPPASATQDHAAPVEHGGQ